jgi:hypothetical protein
LATKVTSKVIYPSIFLARISVESNQLPKKPVEIYISKFTHGHRPQTETLTLIWSETGTQTERDKEPKQPGAGTQMNKVRDMGTQTGKQTDMHKRSGPRLTGTGAQIDRNRDTNTGAQTDTDIEKI